EAISGMARGVNNFLKTLKPVADALGGWDNLAQTALTVFLGAKMLGAISNIGRLAGALGRVGTGLAALPAAGGPLLALIAPAAAVPAWAVKLVQSGDYVAPEAAGAPPKQFGWGNPSNDAARRVYAGGGLSDLARIPKSQGGMGPEPPIGGPPPPAP